MSTPHLPNGAHTNARTTNLYSKSPEVDNTAQPQQQPELNIFMLQLFEDKHILRLFRLAVLNNDMH